MSLKIAPGCANNCTTLVKILRGIQKFTGWGLYFTSLIALLEMALKREVQMLSHENLLYPKSE